MEQQWIACFFSVPHTEFDLIESIFHEYDHGLYAISAECTESEKEHFHFLFEGTDQIYNAFSKRIVEKYKLRRKGRGGLIKYGKVKNIRNLERMLTYTLKDGNYRSNMKPEVLQAFFEKSFAKTVKKEMIDKLVEHVDSVGHWDQVLNPRNYEEFNDLLDTLSDIIIEYLVEEEITHSRSSMPNLIYQFICRSKTFGKPQKKHILKFYHNRSRLSEQLILAEK